MKSRCSAVGIALAAFSPFASFSPLSAQAAPVPDTVGDTVVVTATRQAQRDSDVLSRVEVIERAEVERAGQSTLIDLLRARPGIRVVSNGGAGANSSVFLRGAEARHTLLLIDGMRVGSVSNGAPTLEAIPLGIIDRIEIVRGPASALYGSEAIGGVIQIFTRKGREGVHPELFVGYGSRNTLEASASVAGGVERLRYNLSVGQMRTDGFDAKRNPQQWLSSRGVSSYHPDDDGFRNLYGTASISQGFRQRDEIGINVYGSKGRSRYDTNDYYDSYLDKRVDSVGIHMINQLAEGWTSTLRVGRSQDKLTNVPAATGRSRFDSTQTQFVWQHDVALPLGSLMAAYEYVRSDFDGTTAYTRDRRTVKAALLGWSARLGDHDVQVNVRHDDNTRFGERTTGLLAYGYRFDARWSVQGSIATAFNAPTFNQLYYPDSGSGGGNPDLKPEKALNREIGLRWSDGTRHAEATYFDNRVRDLISSWPPANVAKARLSGLELVYKTRVRGFDLSVGADWLKAEDETTGKRLPRRAGAAAFARFDRSQGAWQYGMEINGQRGRYDNATNTVSLGGYGLVDLYAHYAWSPDWRVEMRANNLLDKTYSLASGYATAGRTLFAGVRYMPR